MVNILPYDKNLEDYICMVFNYFNGRINTVNPAVLTIDWAGKYYHQRSYAAYTILPNRVFFNPMVILRYCPQGQYLRFRIVEFMIHELFHVDQVVQYKRMFDKDYINNIESAVEKQTVAYMKSHMEELKMHLGIYVDDGCMEYLDAVMKYNNQFTHPYEKINLADHLWSIIDQFTLVNVDTTDLREAINYAISNDYYVYATIKGIDYRLRSKGDNDAMVINDINSLFYNVYDGVIAIKGATEVDVYEAIESLIIKLDFNTCRSMCQIVPGKAVRTFN